MADFLVSTVLEQLKSLAIDKLKAEIKRLVGVEEEVEKLQRILHKIQKGLADADQRQLMEPDVSNWLWELKDVSYDIEDVLEEWITSIRKKPDAAGEDENNGPGTKKKVLCFFDLMCSSCYKPVVERHEIAVKIEKLNSKLDRIADEREKYKFNEVSTKKGPPRAKTTSGINIPEIKGRDEDKEKIIGLLLDENSSSSSCSTTSLRVISLVGMGGLGKTTMAKWVYNESEEKNHFEERIWVHVGDPFEEIKVAKAILESLKKSASNLEQMQTVTRLIEESIAGKKFLLVLDDVWNEDSEKWKQLKCSLMHGSSGSRILVTTRNENVASAMGSTKSEIYKLGKLSHVDAWSLFSQVAFDDWSNFEIVGVKDIGEALVKRCEGLPLAIKALGGHLSPYKSREKWLGVSKNQLWEIKKAKEDIIPSLWLSYYDLSPELKRCFSYCAVFPKGKRISKLNLIAAWMAQGYIKERTGEDMEMVGEEYFQDLAAHSIFQDFERDDLMNETYIKMHDMVYDVAQFLSKNECCTLEVNGYGEPNDSSASFQPRHSTLVVSSQSQPLSYFDSLEKLRSLFVKYETFLHIHPDIFSRLTCLRSLNLRSCGVKVIPSTIGELIHLRWLCLSHNYYLVVLPETLCELYYLQTLDVAFCYRLVKLPGGIGKLTNLRHLCNDRSASVLPKGVKDLVNLRTLWSFPVGDGGVEAASLGDLVNLKHLRGQLYIGNLGEAVEVGEAKLFQLDERTGITDLTFGFQRREEEEEKRKHHHRELLEALKPPSSLTHLTIWGYEGTPGFPIWMSSLTSLRKLRLMDCFNCKQLPPLGRLPALELLSISVMNFVERVGPEFLGMETSDFDQLSPVVAFPKLSTLEFSYLPQWETWRTTNTEVEEDTVETTIMPCLRSLQIQNCPNLGELPLYISRKITAKFLDLHIWNCPLLRGKYPCVD